MEEAPENGKELLHSARANGMNESSDRLVYQSDVGKRVWA